MEKKYNLVLISSAIVTSNAPLSYTPTRSFFTHEQRFQQTFKTIQSIKENIPNPYIVLVEGTQLPESMKVELQKHIDYLFEGYLNEELYAIVNGPLKGFGEASSLLAYLQSEHYQTHKDSFETISKISGRYYIRPGFEWKVVDNKIVGSIHYDDPHHYSHIHLSTMFYTVGKYVKDTYIKSLSDCCQHPEMTGGIALEHVLPLCMIANGIEFDNKHIMNVAGEFGPWGGWVCH